MSSWSICDFFKVRRGRPACHVGPYVFQDSFFIFNFLSLCTSRTFTLFIFTVHAHKHVLARTLCRTISFACAHTHRLCAALCTRHSVHTMCTHTLPRCLVRVCTHSNLCELSLVVDMVFLQGWRRGLQRRWGAFLAA